MGSINIAGGNYTLAIVHRVAQSPPDFRAKRTKRWAVRGESELRDNGGGRDIVIDATIYGFSSYDSLREKLDALDRLVGAHGELAVDTDGFQRTFATTTFRGFEPAGGDRDGPLPDVGNGLGAGANYWWVRGTFRFRQLITR